MKEQFFGFLVVMNFVFAFASFGGYEQGMIGIVRCLLQMLLFFIVACVFSLLAENEYYTSEKEVNNAETQRNDK